jgi:hypothetical protein
VIFWTEFSCLRKSYSNKATLLLGRGHRYKNSTVVITIWLTVTKYPISNDNGSFTFYEGSAYWFFLVFCVILLCVFTFRVLCCDVRIKTMFDSSLPPVVCRRVHVLFTLIVFVCAVVSNTYCVVFLFCFSLSCVPYVASFSRLSIFDCPSSIL